MTKKIKQPIKASRFRDLPSKKKLSYLLQALRGSSLFTHACTMHISDRDIMTGSSPGKVIGDYLQTILRHRVTTSLYVIEIHRGHHSDGSINRVFGYHVHFLVKLDRDDILDAAVLRYCRNVKPADTHTKATIRRPRSGTPVLIQQIDEARGGLTGLIGDKGYLAKDLGRKRKTYTGLSDARATRLRFSRDIGQLADAVFEEEKKAARALRKSRVPALPLAGMKLALLPAASGLTEISAQAGESADPDLHGAVHPAVMHAGLVEVPPGLVQPTRQCVHRHAPLRHGLALPLTGMMPAHVAAIAASLMFMILNQSDFLAELIRLL